MPVYYEMVGDSNMGRAVGFEENKFNRNTEPAVRMFSEFQPYIHDLSETDSGIIPLISEPFLLTDNPKMVFVEEALLNLLDIYGIPYSLKNNDGSRRIVLRGEPGYWFLGTLRDYVGLLNLVQDMLTVWMAVYLPVNSTDPPPEQVAVIRRFWKGLMEIIWDAEWWKDDPLVWSTMEMLLDPESAEQIMDPHGWARDVANRGWRMTAFIG